MIEFTTVKFAKRASYYDVFIYYSKHPGELKLPTGVKLAINHLNKTKKGLTISKQHPNYEADTKKIRAIKEKAEAIVAHFYETYGEKPPVKFLQEQFDKPFNVEKRSLNSLIDYYPKFLSFKRRFVSSDESLQPYNSLLMAFKQFQKQRNFNLVFSNLDYEFYYDFIGFLLTERFDERRKNVKSKGLNNNTLKKRMSYLLGFLKFCIVEHEINLNIDKQKMLIQQALNAHEVKSYDISKNNLSLNIHEMLEFHNWNGCEERHRKYKDYCVLQLCTGMRVSDTKLIDPVDVEIREGFLVKYSEKTDDEFAVRIPAIAINILKKHNFRIKIIDHKYNIALKEVFKDFFEYYKPIYENILGKEYKLTKIIVEKKGKKAIRTSVLKSSLASSKMGRVSFVSDKTSDPKLSLKEIMSQTGHRKIQTVQKYMDMSENISREDLNKLLSARGYIDFVR